MSFFLDPRQSPIRNCFGSFSWSTRLGSRRLTPK